jgi:hypothetical protein
MRTLIIGISLPNATFDNASFLNAPSLSEYQRVVVDLGAAARVVGEVVSGKAAHTTYGGHAIVNGAASEYAFGIDELLDMRRREAARLLENGGTLFAFGHPQGTISLASGSEWRSYSWLPDDEDFQWSRDLLPGFGTAGAVLTDGEHPCAPFVQALAPRLAYRIHLDEDASAAPRVFCRSSSGLAIGFDLDLAGGRVAVFPAVQKPESDRMVISQALLECFERIETRVSEHASKEAL